MWRSDQLSYRTELERHCGFLPDFTVSRLRTETEAYKKETNSMLPKTSYRTANWQVITDHSQLTIHEFTSSNIQYGTEMHE